MTYPTANPTVSEHMRIVFEKYCALAIVIDEMDERNLLDTLELLESIRHRKEELVAVVNLYEKMLTNLLTHGNL